MTRTVFTNARLLDGDNPARGGMTIVVEGDRIRSVVEGPHADACPDDAVHDLGGRTLMPGMIIGHYHASYTGVGGGSPMPVGMEAAPGLQTLRAAAHLKQALHSGFTGVVSAGAPYAIDAACKLAIAEGMMEGPRIVAGSRDVSTTGHAQDWFAWHWGPGMSAGTNIVDGADAFRRAVREEIKRGSEIIKIFATTGHGIPGPHGLEVSEAELTAAIEAAHQRGARVRGHLTGADAILTAVQLGIDVVDHGDGVDERCLEEMVARNVPLIPSMLYPARVIEVAKGPFIDAMKADLEEMMKRLPEIARSGVKMTLGDDHGAVPLEHGNYADEIVFYVEEVGIPALDVIRWATRFGGELLSRSDELGTIAPGKLADMIVVDGDPSADVRLLTDPGKLLAVMKGGVFATSRLDSGKTTGASREAAFA